MEAIGHPALRVQLDAKALVANEEAVPKTFSAVKDYLVHFHANEPNLDVLGTSGFVDHAAMGRMLRKIGYDGYVSIEQRLLDENDPLTNVARSTRILHSCYADFPQAGSEGDAI